MTLCLGLPVGKQGLIAPPTHSVPVRIIRGDAELRTESTCGVAASAVEDGGLCRRGMWVQGPSDILGRAVELLSLPCNY